MPSPTASMRISGFTLIEIAIAIALLSVLAVLGIFASQEMYRRQGLSYETETLAVLLIRGRDYALTGLRNTSHGVCFDEIENSFVLFDANGFNETTPRSKLVEITGLPNCEDGGVVFTQLSATTTPTTIILTEGERSMTIDVNREGMITW